MKAALARLRERLTFANVTAATALFVALGGTSYAAINLPENSVGTREIRTGGVGKSEVQTGGIGSAEIHTGAVGKSEIRTGGVGSAELHTDSVRTPEIKSGSVKTDELDNGAVTADKIADGSIGMSKLDTATKNAVGPLLRADVKANGDTAGGNAKSVTHTAGSGVYTVEFGSAIGTCTPTAVLDNVDAAHAGTVTAGPGTGTAPTSVIVHTFDPAPAGGTPTAADLPFHLVVSC